MDFLVQNATLVTMNDRHEVIERGWLAVQDGRITALGQQGRDPPTAGLKRIDVGGKVALPGLVNAHTHLFQTLIRGVYEAIPFSEWLKRIYHCVRALTEGDSFQGARIGALESLHSGVTTVLDHHFLNQGNLLAEAALAGIQAVGLRAAVARTSMDLGALAPPEALETPAQALRANEALLAAYPSQPDGMVTLLVGPNTPGVSASAEMVKAQKEWADNHGLRISCHVAESPSVLAAVRERYGVEGVVNWLDQLGFLDANVVAAHSVHVSADEIRRMGEARLSVVHNPVANLFLGDGIAPVVEQLAASVTVALGTDGAASNNSQDMFEVVKAASLLQRGRTLDANAVTPLQALRMATINGARALGLDHLVGSLEVGKRADIVLVDLFRGPHNVAVHNVVSHLVHCARPNDVDTVIVDGRVLMEGGRVLDLDEEQAMHEGQVAGEALVRRLEL